MFPTFVIGLREGLEASLIVGIIAAFLRRNGSRAGLRQMWLGVMAAVVLCLAAGITLRVVASDLPQRQQEGLETVIAAVAVAMVTYMIVWMKNHSRELKGSLESAAGSALAQSSAVALSAMAFLAVLREGLETVVFLLAAFDASGSARSAALGAALGVVVACGLGYAIYRGGVRINLSRFFRATGVVLALVAAGLVVSALHTGHEAGWVNLGQERTFSLRWLAAPGSLSSSLLTGVLGVQPDPTAIEVIGWLAYVIPVVAIVCWPPTVPVPWRSVSRGLIVAAATAVVAAVGLAMAAPAQPATAIGQTRSLDVAQSYTPGPAAALVHADTRQQTSTGQQTVSVRSVSSNRLVVQWGTGRESTLVRLKAAGSEPLDGITTRLYTTDAGAAAPSASAQPAVAGADTVSLAQLTRATQGRLPLGVSPQTMHGPMDVAYTTTTAYRIFLDPISKHVIDARQVARTVASVSLSSGSAASLGVVATTASAGTNPSVTSAVAAVVHHEQVADRHAWMRVRWPVTLLVLAAATAAVAWWLRRRPDSSRTATRIPRIRRGETA